MPRGLDRTYNEHGGPGSLDPSSHLGSSCDCSIGSQVQAPLAHPHHGLIALLSGLCDVFIDLLGGRETREERLQASNLCSQLCKDTGRPRELGSAGLPQALVAHRKYLWPEAWGCLKWARLGGAEGRV